MKGKTIYDTLDPEEQDELDADERAALDRHIAEQGEEAGFPPAIIRAARDADATRRGEDAR